MFSTYMHRTKRPDFPNTRLEELAILSKRFADNAESCASIEQSSKLEWLGALKAAFSPTFQHFEGIHDDDVNAWPRVEWI